jgi:hypothetical protein
MTDDTTDTTDSAAAQTTDTTDTSTDTTDWKAEAVKWEKRSKENFARAKELEKAQQATMTEAERALSEAEARGRTAAASEFGKRLARTEFDAVAGRRNPDFDTKSALEFVDLSRFLDEDGEPDPKAIKQAVERLVPEPAGGASFDGGARTTAAKGGDMNSIIRKAAGRA